MLQSPRFTLPDSTRDYALLTWTSAMDCFSWSLPAGKKGACPMEDTTPNSICLSCYAQQGRYLFPVVRSCQQARFQYLKSNPIACLNDISSFIHRHRLPYFRVHDSGDFHTRQMIGLWLNICNANPTTKFWFPTRAHTFPQWVPALQALNSLPNVTVRPSAIHFGDEPPVVRHLAAGTVSMKQELPGIFQCPKAKTHTSCGTEECRYCWDNPLEYINYLPHGHVVSRPVALTIGATA